MRAVSIAILAGGLLIAGAFAACGSPTSAAPAPTGQLTAQELRDPSTCAPCHPIHVQQWSGSMHAYATDDPVFLAMNARAQRDTGGAIGTFCLQCHAPMAVREGAKTDAASLAGLPASQRGVTCFFCHAGDAVHGANDAPLHLADDGVMRGAVHDPTPAPHGAAYSPLHDRDGIASAPLCGSCHDIRTPAGVDVATTFTEWQGSLFAHDVAGMRLSCGSCHMPGTEGAIASTGAAPKTRQRHDHGMPGVDVALTDFPRKDAQLAAVQANLDPSLVVKLCVSPPMGGPNVQLSLDNAFVGHGFPSGAGYDRRVWAELVAYTGNAMVYESGVVPDGTSVLDLKDPDLWLFRTKLTDASGAEVLFQFQAAAASPLFVPPAVTNDPMSAAYYHAVTKSYTVPVDADRITARVLVTPIDPRVLADLVASGDLDPSVPAKMPRFALGGSVKEWTKAKGFTCVQ